MNFTLSTVAASLAAYLAPYFPGVTFYEDPNQQGTLVDCFFLQQRYSNTEKQPAGRYLQTIGLDLTYLAEYNLPNLQQIYEQAAGILDPIMETFPYSDGENTGLMRTYNREWRIDLDALHYQFEIQVMVSLPKTPQYMESLEDLTIEVKHEGQR